MYKPESVKFFLQIRFPKIMNESNNSKTTIV